MALSSSPLVVLVVCSLPASIGPVADAFLTPRFSQQHLRRPVQESAREASAEADWFAMGPCCSSTLSEGQPQTHAASIECSSLPETSLVPGRSDREPLMMPLASVKDLDQTIHALAVPMPTDGSPPPSHKAEGPLPAFPPSQVDATGRSGKPLYLPCETYSDVLETRAADLVLSWAR